MRRLLWLLLAAAAVAQDSKDPATLITADSLQSHLKVLAADEYEGRNSGYEGNDKSAEYIAGFFKKWGLKPLGDEGTYLQHFEFAGGRKKLRTQNVVGFVEGKVKDEVVVIGAHFDHVGKTGQENDMSRMKSRKADKDDDTWNGADDNGSGAVTVLEIARAFAEGGVKTRRTVVFILFSGEEWGLLGSAHFVDHVPEPFALKQIVAMINLDMVGRNAERKMDVGGVGTSDGWAKHLEGASAGLDLLWKTSSGVSGGSDHASFARKKIPAVHFFTGFHEDYHCQTDHIDKIAFGNMAKIGRFGLRLLVSIADAEERMKWTGPQAPKQLGIMGSDLTDDAASDLGLEAGQGGIQLTEVGPDSAAERGGLKVRDVILEFNGVRMPRDGAMNELKKQIRAAKVGEDVPVVVLRDKSRLKLNVLWPKDP